MEFELIEKAGLTKGEARTYLALLKIGESSVGNIAKEADVSLSKIYEVLDHLIKKGLVSSIIKNNIKYFSASDPERIVDYLEAKKKAILKSEEEIKKIIPSLKSMKTIKKRSIATLFEGFRGIKNFYEWTLSILSKDAFIYAIGIPKYAAEKYEGYFLDWNKRRAKKGITLKAIYNFDAQKAGKKREKLKLTEVRYLPEQFVSPAWVLIFNDVVATIHLTEKPICVVITDKEVARSYIAFFDFFWRYAS